MSLPYFYTPCPFRFGRYLYGCEEIWFMAVSDGSPWIARTTVSSWLHRVAAHADWTAYLTQGDAEAALEAAQKRTT